MLSVVVLILLGMVWLHLQLNGDIPQVVDRHDVLYEKTVDVQPTSGSIWFASTGWHNPTDYFRLHLSQEDFEKSDISKLPTANAEKGMLGGPIWWNPGQNAQYYQSPGMRHGFQDLYIYDAKRGLLFARCEL